MLDFPITEMMDDAACLRWLEARLHPKGWTCPRCDSANRRLFRSQQAFPAYRCRDCDCYHTILTGTIFEKTRQRPATLVLLIRGVLQGERTARLARELQMSYQQTLTLRQRLQDNANQTAPLTQMTGQTFEADEVYQHAGEKK